MRRIAVVLLLAVGLLLGRSAFGVQQLIVDGGFESLSTAPWQVAGSIGSSVTFAQGTGANTGTGFLLMGHQAGPLIQDVFQQVSVPTNTLLVQFSYFWAMNSTDPTGAAV